ncbi:MAG: hypothetical protein HY226_03370 [Candidatus Vogelbacteria bacterium]|nr:hypothetical protein [Candidatus Vogelbacteria bacterium]
MDEEKVPKQAWWIVAFVAVTAIVAGYFYKPSKKSKKNATKADVKVGIARCVEAKLSSQFHLVRGETAYIEEEGLQVTFAKVLMSETSVSTGPRRKGQPVKVVLEIKQELGRVTESCTIELSLTGRPTCVTTTDELIGQYDIRLMGLEFPQAGDISENNDYVVNLVIFKEKE